MPATSSLTATKFVRRFHRIASAYLRDRPCVAIRREDASIWERRAPLAPYHVEKLTKNGVRILIQPSNRRAYPLQSYLRAGAEVKEDISEAPVILGVKQVPTESLLPSKTYCFFSHTIKAQEANMPLLDAVLERNIRLIDYERMVDDSDNRVVAFGKYAGVAGMINILHGIGLRLLALGHHTPFMHVGPAHNYRNAGTAKQAIRDAGYEIALGKMPRSIGPLTFVFTGSGNVSQGARDLFSELPIEFVDPSDLQEVAERGSTNKIYGSVVTRQDHLKRKISAPMKERKNNYSDLDQLDVEEYTQHPERYYSTFSTHIAPFASVIINGVYWPPNAPRLLTIPDAKKLQQPIKNSSNSQTVRSINGLTNDLNNVLGDPDYDLLHSIGSPVLPHRLIAICDISADPGGSIEFMQDCTTIDNPFYLYDADHNRSCEQSFAGNGILMCSIDNMPTQLPLESTDMFGNLLFPYIMDIVKSNATKPVEEEQFSSVVRRAIIASNGKLEPGYEYIQDLRRKQESNKSSKIKNNRSQSTKHVLVLGAGHVSAPLIEYLCRDAETHVTIASSLETETKLLHKHAKHNNIDSLVMDVMQDEQAVSNAIKDADLVVSLLPYGLHPYIAKICIEHKKNMLTASYLTKDMKELHEKVENAGITVMNEVGLDPGIDHLLAKQIIDDVTSEGGRITSFISYCCGLPTPEFADNPLGYKFGWSPMGAFAITMNGATWVENGQVRTAEPGSLMEFAQPVEKFFKGFSLEAFPNRDSLEYKKLYNLPDARTIIRGSLRYRGFSETIKALKMIGLMDQIPHPYLQPNNSPDITWRQLLSEFLGHSQDLSLSNLNNLVYDRVNHSETKLQAIKELGLFDDELVIKCGTPFNTIRQALINKYLFKANENDLIMMRIDVEIEWPDRSIEEKALNMVVYGDTSNFSAMSKTVGYPAAIAAKMILDGEIQTKGMIVPLTQEIYRPMLRRLKEEGISCLQ